MSSKQHHGSQAEIPTGQIEQVQGPRSAAETLAPGSFSVVGLWRGNGNIRLNFGNGAIRSSSRVVASVSEYNTSWDNDRFIGNADMQILNVAPYNGGAWLRLNVGWGNPINVCVTLIVDP